MKPFAAVFFLLAMISCQATVAAPRNVVLFVTDDQGQDAGCYGNQVIRTPHLDRLAAEGTIFPYAFCTTASCSASRSVILTGMFNHANAQYGHEHSYHHFSSFDSVRSLPVMLAEAGYRTGRVGKFHVAPESVYRFDVRLPGNARSPVEMAENCRSFVADGDRPFFLYFCTADPHRSGDRADDVPQRPDRFGNRPAGKEYPGIERVKYDPGEVVVPPFLPDTPSCRAELAQYYQSVSRVDQGLGRLIEVLKEAGVYDDTLIIFISDHGIAFPGAKTTTYEPGLRSPCVVRNPYAKRRGVTNQAMISWVDLTPTILDFAGAAPREPKHHGRSFLPVLEENQPTGWDEIHASHTFHEITMYYPMRVVRNRRYKLIWNIAYPLPYPFASDLWEAPTWQDVYRRGGDARYGRRTVDAYIHRPQFELYDLESDPNETHNLAHDAAHAQTLSDLKGNLRAFQQRTGDPWILKWEYE
ncbi:MAG TPA: sulfatase [Pirellulales bacterium]|nr:sulfatase [Pirellulales bacterium]